MRGLTNARVAHAVLAAAVVTFIVLAIWQLRVVRNATTSKNFLFKGADLFTYSYPMYERGFAELGDGRLFLWNPHQLCGNAGLAAAPGVGLFYPPNLIHLVLPTASAIEINTVVHLILAILFATLAGRVFHMSWAASLIVGGSFGLSAALPVIFWPAWIQSLVWLPLGIASMERSIQTRDWRWLAVVSISAAMPWLTSAPGSATQLYFAFGAYLAVSFIRLAVRRQSLGDATRRIIPPLLALAAGVALAAPQILPTLELAQSSERMTEKTSFEALKAFILPFGKLPAASVLRNTLEPPPEFSLGYLGAVPIALVAAAFTRRRLRLQGFCLVLVTWGTLEMLIPDWYLQIRAHVPLLGLMRTPQRSFGITVFAVALLAGAGYDALRNGGTVAYRRYLAAGLVGAASFCAAWFRYPGRSWWVPVCLIVLAVASAVSARSGTLRSALIAGAAMALLLVDLIGFSDNSTMLPYVNESWRLTRRHEPLLEEVRGIAALERTVLVDASNRFPGWAPKTAMLERLFTIQDYEPLALSQYGDYFNYAALGTLQRKNRAKRFFGSIAVSYYQRPSERLRRFFNLLSVRYLISPRLKRMNPAFNEFVGRLVPVKLAVSATHPGERGLAVFEDPQALPRAYAVYGAECYREIEDQLARLAAPELNPRRTVVLQGQCAEQEIPTAARAPLVTIESYEATAVKISAQMEKPGWLVLTDSYYPGWTAFVNGTRQPIWRANAVVRAVQLPAGPSAVEFRFVPWSFYAGLILAGAAAFLCGAWGVWQWRRVRLTRHFGATSPNR
jgi:uncharacterized membrane protein YfhO